MVLCVVIINATSDSRKKCGSITTHYHEQITHYHEQITHSRRITHSRQIRQL